MLVRPFRTEIGILTIWSWLRAVARPIAIVLGLGVGIAGCTALPGDGPWMGGAQGTATEALPFDVIDLTPTTIAAYALPPGIDQDRPSTTSNLSAGGKISVAAGDALRVRIFEPMKAASFPVGGRRLRCPARDGRRHHQCSYVGTVRVAARSRQIERRIAQQVKESGKAQDPQVIVELWPINAHRDGLRRREEPAASPFSKGEVVVEAINRAGGRPEVEAGRKSEAEHRRPRSWCGVTVM